MLQLVLIVQQVNIHQITLHNVKIALQEHILCYVQLFVQNVQPVLFQVYPLLNVLHAQLEHIL